MKLPLSVFVAISMAGIIVDPPDPEPLERLFFNVEGPPYHEAEEYLVNFKYRSPVAESTRFDIFFSSASYKDVLVYSLQVSRALDFAGSLTLPSFLMAGSSAALEFQATGYDFQIIQTLPLYRATRLNIAAFADVAVQSFGLANYCRIDETGTSVCLGEEITFEGYTALLSTDTYLALDLEPLRFRVSQPDGQPIRFFNGYLYIGDPFRALPLFPRTPDNLEAIVPLAIVAEEGGYGIGFTSTFYVEPTTFLTSLWPIGGFVPSAKLYFPKDRFRTLQNLAIQIVFDIAMHNTFAINYETTYFSEQALIGPCLEARYCVTTTTGLTGGGVPEVVTVTYG